MSRPSFEYPDENGTVLGVEPGPGPAGDMAAVSVADMTCYVLAEHRTQVAAGLWTGTGAPAPVILERPEFPEAEVIPGLRFERNGTVVEACRTSGNWQMTPAAARHLAASLAILADQAENEPDPADVEELAALIRSELYPPSESIGLRPSRADRTAARAALRYMRDKRQREEERP